MLLREHHPRARTFNPNGTYQPALRARAHTQRGSLAAHRAPLGLATEPATGWAAFDDVLDAFRRQLTFVIDRLVGMVNRADAAHSALRRYPLMSLFIDDCIAAGQDVCAGGARYDLTGAINAGLPNVVNSLAAIRTCVFEERTVAMADLLAALAANFEGYGALRQKLLAAPKWGNGDTRVDDLAAWVTDLLYASFASRTNARGGRWQAALYSFIANHGLGSVVGASADGRLAGDSLTRNLNPTWGTDRRGPTAVLQSLSAIDFTGFPDGCSLDLRFDPTLSTPPKGATPSLRSSRDLSIWASCRCRSAWSTRRRCSMPAPTPSATPT